MYKPVNNNQQITFSRVINLSDSMMLDCYYVITQTLPHLADEFYYRAQRDVNRDNHIMFIAETPCMIVGVLKGLAVTRPNDVHGQIDCLCVDKKFRCRGIGEKLLQAYEECLRREHNATYVSLKSAAGAFDFYLNRGYIRNGASVYLKKSFSR